MPSVLEVKNLRVARGRAVILRDLDWRVNPGEHWAILGANGSGKTSLLKALTGYLSPTAGDISLLGRQYGACDWRELRLRVGVVTSAFAASIPPAELAIETVESGKFAQLDLWHETSPSDRRAALRWLTFVGLAGIAEREWAYLSQGERQRVLIARALMARPELLILDEPCAGLDPVAREHFLQFIEQLTRPAGSGAKRTRTPALILVTHHVEEIMPGFTHALLLRSGEAVAAGPRNAVLTSANLSATFGAPLRVSQAQGRLRLAFARA